MKYNYVIFGSDWDLYRFSYNDIIGLENVRYLDKPFGECGKLLSFVQRIHKSRVLNSFINIPFKNLWNSFYFYNDFKNNKPICFIFLTDQVIYVQEYNYFQYLKGRYPNSKFVWFLNDILSSRGGKYKVEELKNIFDLIISFDPGDCERYGFVYHPLVFSSFNGKVENMQETDIYFLGHAKNRFSKIISVYEKLRSAGLKCDFYIVGVDKKKQVYTDEIKYNQRLDYAQNLQHVIHSKCLLEVMQKDGLGYTQRVIEILGLNKKLLTDNPNIINEEFYNSKYISRFNSVDDIDLNFISNIKNNEDINYNYKGKLSPKYLLEFIECYFNNQE